ncbi:hypothetical protein D9M71_348650 [compost metagenome]
MVLADGGGIQHVDAIAEHLQPSAIQAADHRAAGAGAEARRVHAGQAVEGLAERRTATQHQLVAFQHRRRSGHLLRAAGQRAGADHAVAEFQRRGFGGQDDGRRRSQGDGQG